MTLFESRYFIWRFTKSLVNLRYRGSYLGPAWNVIQPALYLLVLGFVFSTVNRARFEDYVVYLFAGLIPWRFFEQACLTMMDSILGSAPFTGKIQIPYAAFPVVRLGVSVTDFVTSFVVLLALFLLFQVPWHFQMVVLPLSVLVWILIATGAGLILSVLFVFFQDIRPLVQMCLMLVLFSSTIFFKGDTLILGTGLGTWLTYDPVCYWVALFQRPIYFGEWPGTIDWFVSLASGLVMLTAGILLYRKLQRRFYYYF